MQINPHLHLPNKLSMNNLIAISRCLLLCLAVISFGALHGQTNTVVFDGKGTYLDLPDNISTDSEGFTFETWLYYSGAQRWARVMDFGNDTKTNMFLTASAGTPNVPRFMITKAGKSEFVDSELTLQAGNWYHLAIVFQGTAFTMYLNGESVAEKTFTLTPAELGPLTNKWIGKSHYSWDDYLKGKLAEIRIWNVARTAAEIKEGMNCALGGSEEGLSALYQFKKSAGSIAVDSRGGSEGTLRGDEAVPGLEANEQIAAKLTSCKEEEVMAGNNHALLFNGTNSYVDCGDILTPSYTKELWIKLDVDKLKSNNNMISGSSGHAFRMLNGKADAGHNGSWQLVQDPNPIEAGWQHYAVTYDDSTQTMVLYRNGESVAQQVGVPPVNSDAFIQLGRWGTCCQFLGKMDEVRIWDHARSSTEIAGDYKKALTGSEPGLIAYYNFNQGVAAGDNQSETVLKDLTGKKNGTLKDFALTAGSTSNFVASDLQLGGEASQPEVISDAEEFGPEMDSETEKVLYQLPLTSEPSVITVEKVGDYAVFEGDIVLYELGGPEDPNSGISNDAGIISGIGQHDYRWAQGEIPYVIAAQHPKQAEILSAIQKVNAQSVLNIRPKKDSDKDYVMIENPTKGCWSAIGRKGGKQRMGISNGCSVGNVMHEFLHAAGMYHEQSRADRDQFLKIDFANIEENKKGNFEERESKSVCDFDFGSIMQYPSWAFAKDKSKPTIIPLKPLPQGVVMGQRGHLSECDKMGILNLYKTISPQAKPYEPFWFTDVFQRSSYRVQGNIYNTGEDWNWKARTAPIDASLSDFYKDYFNFQKEVMNDFKVTEFSFEDCKIKIKGTSSKRYLFDVRYGRADLYNQWYDGQYGAISRPASDGDYELSFETTLSKCNTDPEHTYFVVLVVKNYDDQTGYLIAEAPMAIRYAHSSDSDD